MSTRKRSPSPSPTVTLDAIPKPDLQRSSSEESVRVIHHAVLFPSSPHLGRVTYIRRAVEVVISSYSVKNITLTRNHALKLIVFIFKIRVTRNLLEDNWQQ